jgi:hypothetical protein
MTIRIAHHAGIGRRDARSGACRRFAVVLGLLIPLSAAATGCSIEEVLPAPNCVGDSTVILAAQSVPTAEFVPCFEPLPAGWDVVTTTIDQDGTVVRFDSDRAGSSAAVFRYADACDLTNAVRAPSEFAFVDRYELVERVSPALRSQRFYVFDGGCAWWEFDFDADAPSVLSIELGDQLELLSRLELNQSIHETFIDEDV